MDFIKFDKSFTGNQKLVTHFRNVETVGFQGLHVDEAIEVTLFLFIFVFCEKIYDDETYKTVHHSVRPVNISSLGKIK